MTPEKLNALKLTPIRPGKPRPEMPAHARKNFKSLLEKEPDCELSEEVVFLEDRETEKPLLPSPFDLAARQSPEKTIETPPLSFKELPSIPVPVMKKEPFAAAKSSCKSEKKVSLPENPQNVSSFVFQPHLNAESSQAIETPPEVRTSVKDIAVQMIRNLQTIEREGKVDTIITLQYPPLFAEATITLTEMGGKKEFSLSFANLREEAKVFLDKRIVEEALVETLARHDIVIQHLTTSTLPETSLNFGLDSNTFGREERENQRERRRNRYPDEEA
ncbi:MAG: hypothetical protein LW832_04755 [Parachlamydia sp.]|nr:hypothetical protein [Parachlamydia sp.]